MMYRERDFNRSDFYYATRMSSLENRWKCIHVYNLWWRGKIISI